MTLVAEDLSVVLKGREVLHHIRFAAEPGELVAIVGPNGAGKTTLLKAVACLIDADGRLEWRGRTLAEIPAAERARLMAYLPQGHVAHWPIAARQVVALGRAPLASSLNRLHPADEDAIDQAIDAVDAASFADRPITELSGGERARIMLARALAVGAPLLLADEPVASLDPEHQLGVMTILADQARAGRLVLAVSHDLLLAARFADRVLVLSEGRIVASGAAGETLKPELLRDVFKVETLPLHHEGGSLAVPWSPSGRT